MKRLLVMLLAALLLSGCDIFNVSPQPFPVWTAIPTRTPGVVSPTPVVLIPTMTASPTPGFGAVTSTPPVTDTPLFPVTETPSLTPVPAQAMQVVILGCNTGFDITHGMGEVTNAFVTLKNTGSEDLPNACGLLRAADEGRAHPDKVKCVDNLPAGYQVTLQLTVDTTYKKSTIIQVDATSNGTLLLRVDKQSCKDLDLIGEIPADLGVIKPIQP